MEFGWHEKKDETTRRYRGFGFEDVIPIFARVVLETVDDRHDYGEVRVKAIGALGEDVFTVLYTQRGEVRWIISARRASRKERRLWRAARSE